MVKKKKSSSSSTQPVRRKGFSGLNPNNSSAKIPRVDELVDLFTPTKKFQLIRFVGDVFSDMTYWIEIDTANGITRVPKKSLSYDPDTDTMDSSKEDPYLDLPNTIQQQKYYYVNAIIRDLQDDEPRKKGEKTKQEKKTGFKEKGSAAWTPIRVVRLTPGVVTRLQALREINQHRVKGKKQSFDLTDPQYGCDIYISFDKDSKSVSDKYKLNKGETTKITKEEAEYLQYDLSKIQCCETLEVAIKEAENLRNKCPDIEDEDEDDITPKKKKSSKGKDKKSKKDGLEKPKKKKSKVSDDKPKKKKKKIK